MEEDIISNIFNHQISNKLPLFFERSQASYDDQRMIESFITEIYNRYKIRIERWNPNKIDYPNVVIID